MLMDPTGETEVKATLTLPDGYTVTMPADVKQASAFAEYTSTYALEQGGDELAALRTYTIPSPLDGEYASADFLLLLGDNHAEDVRFLKGDDALKKAVPALTSVTYRAPLPSGSKAKVLRRGIVACTTGSKTCLLVLLPAGEAQIDS
jgi:hypothetical protein